MKHHIQSLLGSFDGCGCPTDPFLPLLLKTNNLQLRTFSSSLSGWGFSIVTSESRNALRPVPSGPFLPLLLKTNNLKLKTFSSSQEK